MATTARKNQTNPGHPIGRFVFAAAVTAASAFLLASLASFDPADPPTHLVYPANSPAHNLCGPVGAWAAYQLVRVLGFASWLLVLAGIVYSLLCLGGKRVTFASLRLVGVVMLAVAVAGFQAMLFPRSGASSSVERRSRAGSPHACAALLPARAPSTSMVRPRRRRQ